MSDYTIISTQTILYGVVYSNTSIQANLLVFSCIRVRIICYSVRNEATFSQVLENVGTFLMIDELFLDIWYLIAGNNDFLDNH